MPVIDKVISFISGDSEPSSDKDALLKQQAKELSLNKHAKLYRIRQREADTPMGQLFYSIYAVVYPLQTFFSDPSRDAKIKQVTLEAFLDKQTMEVIKRISPEGIAERKKSAGADLPKLLQEDITALAAGFDNPRIAEADSCYNLIAAMKQFVSFDFMSVLEKFDPDITEGNFSIQPKFTPVDINLLAPELAAFVSVLPSSEGNEGWKKVFEILKYCKGGTDVIPLVQWNNLLLSLMDLKQSNVFEFICRQANGDPVLEIKAIVPHETLSAHWLEQKIAGIREIIAGILDNQKNAQINALVQAVFGSLETTRLANYTIERGRVLIDKDLDGYIYAPALNHLFTFIMEYLRKEFQELCDIILVRGKWTNIAASRQMSEGFHSVIEIVDEIAKLDETLSEDGSEGSRLRGGLLRVDRDKTQYRYINGIISTINEEALIMINKAVPFLIVVGKHFKMLMEDCEKKPTELIINWKELATVTKIPLPQRIAAAYKKINYFVQLMILETHPAEG